MEHVFEITDKSRRKIHLTKERWEHITTKHTNMSDKLEDVKMALTNPIIIVPHKYNEDMRNYYLYYKLEKHYLLVSVKYLNGEGFVATSFITKKLIKR